jgi:hypothetical protein
MLVYSIFKQVCLRGVPGWSCDGWGARSWLWGGKISQTLPFLMEVRDGQLLLLVVGFCVGSVYVVIIGVYRGAVVYMVPLRYRSILRKKCVFGVKIMGDAGNVRWVYG